MAFGRQLSTCKHRYHDQAQFCQICGIKKHQSEAIKTVGFCNPIHINMKLYLKQMRKRSAKIVSGKEISESTYIMLISICDKFSYGIQTLALGLHLYQTLHTMSQYQKFWASCCLLVASKGMELDKNVPYLNRYQRYADKDHTQEEYEVAQRTIFQGMDFDIQYSTFVTFINYYLTCGVIFTKDELNKSLVQYLEDDTLLKAKQYLRKGNCSQWNQQKLALFIIKDIRKKYNLSEWSDELESLTGYTSDEINIEGEDKALQPKRYDINQGLTLSTNHAINSTLPKTQKVVDLKNICIRKKLDQVSISKTLVTRASRPNSSAKENSTSVMGSSYGGLENSVNFGVNNSFMNQKIRSNNVVLAPINSQYLSNNSIFNLTTKRR